MPFRSRPLVHFLIFVVVLGVILLIGSPILNAAVVFVGLAFFGIGSAIALWRMWKHRDNPRVSTFPSQVSVLPKKWQKWVLGESDDDKRG